MTAPKFPRLFEGKEETKAVTIGSVTEKKYTKPIIEMAGPRPLMMISAGVQILNETREVCTLIGEFLPTRNIIAGYRVMRMTEELRVISQECFEEIVDVIFLGPANDPVVTKKIRNSIGHSFNAILKETPPTLLDVVRTLKLQDIPFDQDAITHEIREGNLEYQRAFARYEIFHPTEEEMCRQEMHRLTEPHLDIIHTWLHTMDLSDEERKIQEEKLLWDVLECILWKIETPIMITGYAMSNHALMAGFKGPLGDMAANEPQKYMKLILANVAEFLTEYYDEKSPDPLQMQDALKQLIKRKNVWEKSFHLRAWKKQFIKKG